MWILRKILEYKNCEVWFYKSYIKFSGSHTFQTKTAFQQSPVWSVSQFIACPSVCLRVGLWYFTDWWREWIYSNNILIQCHRDQIFNNVMQKILLINQLVITLVPYNINMGNKLKDFRSGLKIVFLDDVVECIMTLILC